MDDDKQGGRFWEHPEAKARAVNEATKALRSSSRLEDTASSQPLDDAITSTSRCLLAWIEAAAAADNERRFFQPELLTSCCRYMEALATARPARFSAGCQSLAAHAAAVLMRAVAGGGETESSTTLVDEDAAESVTNGNAETDVGAAPSANGNAETGVHAAPSASAIEERESLDRWVDMLGICLLPFCGGSAGDSRANEKPFQDSADGFYSDSDGDDTDDESGGSDRGNGFAHGKARSGWVAGWMRRAGMAGAETPECPFDLQPGGRDEGLPLRLAVMIASRAKAAAGASRPASVSSLATALAVLCSFAATGGGESREGHSKVSEEAFTCLIGLAEAVPESSAQAECVKAALVSLKECAEVTRLENLEEHVTSSLSALEGVPSRMKLLLTRSKSEGPKAFSTSRSFCREALAAAVACARTLIGRAGAPIVAEKPRWFLGEFVVKMASPMLLGDAVKALRAAASVLPSSEELQAPGLEEREREGERAGRALREVVLPGTVERLSKAVGSIKRYSRDAAKEVLKGVAWLVTAAQEEVLPHRERLGMSLVECASSEGRVGGAGGIGQNDKVRLCLRAIRLLVAIDPVGGEGAAAATGGGVDGTAELSSASTHQAFAEAALELTCSVVEREWIGRVGGGGGSGESAREGEGGQDAESVVTAVEAHLTLVALLRSRLRVPGLGPDGERPPLADRLSKVAWSFAHRVRKAAEPGASACLADDDIMLLCQGSEVLEALTECGHVFFEGFNKLVCFAGDPSPVTIVRGCHDKANLHPVVYDACCWVQQQTVATAILK